MLQGSDDDVAPGNLEYLRALTKIPVTQSCGLTVDAEQDVDIARAGPPMADVHTANTVDCQRRQRVKDDGLGTSRPVR